MNIQEELRISNYQPISFLKDTEMGDLYEAMVEKWRLYMEMIGAERSQRHYFII